MSGNIPEWDWNIQPCTALMLAALGVMQTLISAHTEVIRQPRAAQSLDRVIIVSRNSSPQRKAGSSAVLSHQCIVTEFIPQKGLLEGQERGKFTSEIATRALILFASNYSSSRYHLFAHGAENSSQSQGPVVSVIDGQSQS